jgi:hypothetical protein
VGLETAFDLRRQPGERAGLSVAAGQDRDEVVQALALQRPAPFGPASRASAPVPAETGGRVRTKLGKGTAMASPPFAAPVDLNQPGHYVHWGVVQISVANLVVIGLMVLVFVAALLLPFPKGKRRGD